MKNGDIGLAALPQEDGQIKLRPVLLLKHLPDFGDFIVCGLTYIHTLPLVNIQGKVGEIPQLLHAELLKRLANFFSPNDLV